MITLKKFKKLIKIALRDDKPKHLREGQYIFNLLEYNYGDIVRQVQFEDNIDCFYDNSKIDAFIEAVYNRISSITPDITLEYDTF